MMQLIERGVWSDEVEAICRVGARIVNCFAEKPIKWQSLLPEKFIESATLPTILTGDAKKANVRAMSKQLDGLVQLFAGLTQGLKNGN